MMFLVSLQPNSNMIMMNNIIGRKEEIAFLQQIVKSICCPSFATMGLML
ncbi:MAG: hypothetical protein FWD66_07990 [Paludibacter sp.]|nr:hypothetical protein [Paludibacter sp.]